MKQIPKNATVRISIGYYPQEKADTVATLLAGDFNNSIMPAVKSLKGNLAYYVAQDRDKNAITNVSIWESKEAAAQMDTIKEMAEMRDIFLELGFEFVPISNHEMIWALPE